MAKRKYQKKRLKVSLAMPNGDHGTCRHIGGTVLEKVPDDKNNMYRRRRISQVDFLHRQARHKLSLRQFCAAKALQQAHERVEALSSGSELKAKVDTTPKPDACVEIQVTAMGEEAILTKGIDSRIMKVVEHVCFDNLPISEYNDAKNPCPWADLKVGLDLVANRLDTDNRLTQLRKVDI